MDKKYTFDEFMNIIRTLRSENGCPWDRKQTHESLKKYMIEETYEVIDAVDRQDLSNLCEELGDVLLQIALHTAIAEEEKEFSIEDVIHGVSSKMIHRHPHVFGTAHAKDDNEVLKNWEEIKREEKKETTTSESILRIPRSLPANIRAEKVQKKALDVGYGHKSFNEVINHIEKSLYEIKQSKEMGNMTQINESYEKLLFLIVNLSGFLQLNAENSLTNATNKFINRFVDIERMSREKGRSLAELSGSE
jgi:tetrapyrrole methylase family protein/MazG family protein